MDAKEIIDRLSTELDKIYAKKAVSWSANDINNTLFDGLESIIIDYYEELHPQGCGKSILSDIKIPELKEVHITQEQLDNALKNILKPQKDDRFKTILIQIPGFPSTKSIEEELRQELIKTIKDEISKP